jgi:hypothetical protein
MKKFTLGVITGVSTLAFAVPLLAQVSSAANGSSTSAPNAADRPAPSQACVQALSAKDDLFLSTVDAMTASQKTATQAHKAALVAAAAITDDAARKAAVQKAEEDFHTAMKAGMEQNQTAGQAVMEKIRTECGNLGKHGGMFMMNIGRGEPGMKMMKMRGHGPMGGMLAEKLGMTAEGLKAAIDSGKTIEQIAEEKGVTLPVRGERPMMKLDATEQAVPAN